jgi:alkanesulfonate monooxygenase SsuD/methylene tetrahydromethanopterin reductase-like flavin-dependent oxidoreductase (luciferase family)
VIVDVQFSAGTNDWPRLRDATLAAEHAGFGAAWVFDHLAGRTLRGTTMLEAFTLLGALAASTTSIPLGTLVVNCGTREPGVVAVAAASVQAIAGRPLLLGLGAGSSPISPWAAELHAVGARPSSSLADRHRCVEQVIDLLDAMWTEPRNERFETFPLPHPRPAVVVGVSGTRLARLAGRRADGINVPWSHPRRADLLAAADPFVGERPWLRTTWARWDEALLDPAHGERAEMTRLGLDRLVLSDIGPLDPDRIAGLRPAG